MSVHAPYYINFANYDPDKREKSREYIYHSYKVAKNMQAQRVVFHTGSVLDWLVTGLNLIESAEQSAEVAKAIDCGMLYLVPASMREHELLIVQRLRDLLRPNDIVVADRLYCTYAYLAQLVSEQLHAVIRVPASSRRVDFRPHRRHAAFKHWTGPQSIWIRRLGQHDQIVDWIKPAQVPSWLPRAIWEGLPELLRVRELRYRITRRGFRTHEVTLVTSLLDPAWYPKQAVAELYGRRWQVETNMRHLKTTMKMDILRCQTAEGIFRELAVFGIVYNAVRLVMIHAGEVQGVPPDRISFIDVLRWLELGGPGRDLPRFIVNPVRCRSPAPRRTRRRPKPLTYLTQPRTPQRKLPNDQELLSI